MLLHTWCIYIDWCRYAIQTMKIYPFIWIGSLLQCHVLSTGIKYGIIYSYEANWHVESDVFISCVDLGNVVPAAIHNMFSNIMKWYEKRPVPLTVLWNVYSITLFCCNVLYSTSVILLSSRLSRCNNEFCCLLSSILTDFQFLTIITY